jgi:hypothetical protein
LSWSAEKVDGAWFQNVNLVTNVLYFHNALHRACSRDDPRSS